MAERWRNTGNKLEPFKLPSFTMKFYIHFDGPPEFTMVFRWSRSHNGNLKYLMQTFLDAFNAKYSPVTKLSVDNTALIDKRRTALSIEREVNAVVKDGADLFVVARKFAEPDDSQRTVCDSFMNLNVSSNHSSEIPSEKDLESKEARRRKTKLGSANPPTTALKKDLKGNTPEHASGFTLPELKKAGSLRKAAGICAQALQVEENNFSALSCLAEIYLEAGRPNLALEYIEAAVKVNPNNAALSYILGNCLAENERLEDATKAYIKCMINLETSGASQREIHNVQAAIAKIFAKQGNIQMAQELFANVLKEDDTHVESLRGFAIHTAGNSEEDLHEAIAIMTSALVQSKGNREIRKQFAGLLNCPGGMGVFKNQLSEAWESSESMMYMADILRDAGAIKQALELVNRAHQLSPLDPSVCLYLVHTYEILNEHNHAFSEARTFMKENRSLKIGNISFSQIVPFLEQVTENIYLNNAPLTVFPNLNDQDGVAKALDSEFQQLGLLFTLVKILFIKGALNLVEPLLPVLDKLHDGRNLHLTLLQNEAAFYSCISHVMKVPFSPLHQNLGFVYFASDSHCISPAWRLINYRGKPHVIHPLLATGVKIWHMRKENCFYPKFSLLNALNAIPDSSVVIFNIGEIDCREGLLQAINSCKYDTMEEAIETVVEIYVRFLQEQMEQRDFYTFVHPVFPVLDETRTVVLQFNEKLEKCIKNCNGLHWLDFLDTLLANGHSEFNSSYKLDGTHVHPKYVTLLEKALADAVNQCCHCHHM